MKTLAIETSHFQTIETLSNIKIEISQNTKKTILGVSAICALFLGAELAMFLLLGSL